MCASHWKVASTTIMNGKTRSLTNASAGDRGGSMSMFPFEWKVVSTTPINELTAPPLRGPFLKLMLRFSAFKRPFTRPTRQSLFLAFIAGLLAFASGCSNSLATPAPADPKVVVTSPLKLAIVEWDEYIGRLAPIEEVEVRARVSGHLQSTHFVEGQIVQAGDLLCILDQRPFRLAVEQAEADLARAKAKKDESAAQLVQAEAEVRSVESQRELAAQLLDRAKRLVANRTLTQEELDIRESNFKQATADRDIRLARVNLARAAVLTAQAELRADQSRLATAKLNLEYTEIRAPLTGRISNRAVTDGNLISGGTENSTLLTRIVSLDPIHCYFDADEQSLLKYTRLGNSGALADLRKAKLPVHIRLADERNGFPHQGHLDFLDNRLDRKTATIRGRAILPNSDLTLTPGLFAKVRIPGSARKETVLIPESAIGTDQTEKFVFTVNASHTVERRKIEIGRKARGLRIVTEGLQGDESIVLRGLQRVRPGATVDATPELTVALNDGLPDDVKPVAVEHQLNSYVSKPAPETVPRTNISTSTAATTSWIRKPGNIALEGERTR